MEAELIKEEDCENVEKEQSEHDMEDRNVRVFLTETRGDIAETSNLDVDPLLECSRGPYMETEVESLREEDFQKSHDHDHTYAKNSLLRRYYKSSVSNKLHQCHYCYRMCANARSLIFHIQSKHTMDRPHQCAHCSYASVRKSLLKTHILSKHTTERPHMCPDCDYASASERCLKYHITSKHSVRKPLKCLYCDFTCVLASAMKRHVQARHTKERSLRCPLCFYTGANQYSLNLHIRVRHTVTLPLPLL